VGPRAGQKLFTLQSVPAREPESEQQGDGRSAAKARGFSLHADLDIPPHQREKLERCVPLREQATDCSAAIRADFLRPGLLHAQDCARQEPHVPNRRRPLCRVPAT